MDKTIKKIIFNIIGMSCISCASKIEAELNKTDGISDAQVTYNTSKAQVSYIDEKIDVQKIHNIVKELGYDAIEITIKDTNSKKKYDTAKKIKIAKTIGLGIIIFAAYIIIKNTIGFNFLPKVSQSMGYGMLFVVGLLTSFHCIAMCGGINLSQCVSNDFKEDTSVSKKMKPALLYNTGRVIAYTIIGGIVGTLGSVVSFSGQAKGIVAIMAGLFMLIMGLNMMGLFPKLRKIIPRMPKIFGKKIHSAKKNKSPFIVGLLNGFMPCGPLQTMQLYALGTGSFMAGALSMFLFSLGTVPLMFGFGALSSLLSSKFSKKIMKVSAVLVMLLGIIMVSRGLSQSGIAVALASSDSANVAKIKDDIQIVSTNMEPNIYEPLIVQSNIPIRWTINVEEGDLNGCNNPIAIPKYGIEKKLVVGENIIEFTPTDDGNIVYTCWMGMISGNIKVVSDISQTTDNDIEEINTVSYDTSSGGGCCSTDSYDEGFDNGKVPTDEVAIGKIENGIQTVTINVNETGFSPALLILQKDIPTKWNIIGETLDYCNNSLIFPEYGAKIDLQDGENIIEFLPKVDFIYNCWMGMLNGYIKVIDDIEDFDIEAIKTEIGEYVSPTGGGSCG